ncbi:hypothetical protein L6452_24766 [Arctium lappa]|uniref:Uncharacterized protein n=1 Tax=Arctium lappa TaxID=4217 RepID=A0ACB9AEA9_ARCLA|nr:hypothetical protein L6452_24766 [Arctium lappa]
MHGNKEEELVVKKDLGHGSVTILQRGQDEGSLQPDQRKSVFERLSHGVDTKPPMDFVAVNNVQGVTGGAETSTLEKTKVKGIGIMEGSANNSSDRGKVQRRKMEANRRN